MSAAHEHPAVIEARRIADDVLFPSAQQADQAVLLDRDRFAALAEAGLFGIAAPAELGFADLDPATARRVIATIGGACGATFFSWVQHHGVVRTVRGSTNSALRQEWLEPLGRGNRIAGVAFAHLRRPGRRAIEATRIDGGWRLDGTAPWATSWGIADGFAIAAESADGELVWSMLPGSGHAGMAARPLGLPVFSSTGTVELHFDGCEVPDAAIIAVDDAAAWRRDDRPRAAIGQPAVLGIVDRAISLLREAVRGPDDPARATAERLAARLDATWADDERLLGEYLRRSSRPATTDESDAGGTDGSLDDGIAVASDHRAACLSLGHATCMALLAAVGGGGMDLDHPAQRLARETSFYVIQAQTADGRAATLRSASRSVP